MPSEYPLLLLTLSNSRNLLLDIWEKSSAFANKSSFYIGCLVRWNKKPSRNQLSLRDLNQIFIERDILDLLETSQKRRLFCDVFKTSQKHLKKTSFVWRLKEVSNISQKRCLLWRLWDVSIISVASICDFLKIPCKMIP